MLEIGSTAPAFSLQGDDEATHTLADYAGTWLVVYFYPKDDTPGCTTEACTIAEVYDEFATLGVTVLGVSKDSVASHKKFKEKYQLPFTLLSNESTEMIQAYGTWQEKSMYGKKYMGIVRATYIIDPAGNVVKVYPKVTPASHALELLQDLKELV
ncbi:peroxiredoxin [Candidatus Kaiserbacteria bacterium]|nr:peroxiredoxin [Candidatus Kaiserbacteria bacterium]